LKSSKHEIRNPKQNEMTEIQMGKPVQISDLSLGISFLSLGNWILGFVSDFEIRISDL